jgi:hypothetical protein
MGDSIGQILLYPLRFEPIYQFRLWGGSSRPFDRYPYFCNYRTMKTGRSKKSAEQVARYADVFSAMGTAPRLRIMPGCGSTCGQ